MRGYFSVSPSDPTAPPRVGPTLRLRGEGLDHSSLGNWAAEPLLGLEVTLDFTGCFPSTLDCTATWAPKPGWSWVSEEGRGRKTEEDNVQSSGEDP